MVEILEEICGLIIDDLSSKDSNLLDEPNVTRALNELRRSQNLHPKFNLAHRKDNHKRYFYIKNCQSIHCFECLAKEINENRTLCEHNAPLTKSEVVNIRVLSVRI